MIRSITLLRRYLPFPVSQTTFRLRYSVLTSREESKTVSSLAKKFESAQLVQREKHLDEINDPSQAPHPEPVTDPNEGSPGLREEGATEDKPRPDFNDPLTPPMPPGARPKGRPSGPISGGGGGNKPLPKPEPRDFWPFIG